jgi:hypothetical protein
MAMFRRSGTEVLLDLEEIEVELLNSLIGQILELLHDPEEEEHSDPLAKLVGLNGPTVISSDPVLARLFPDAYPDDETNSADFRRFTQPDLQRQKIFNAHIVRNDLLAFPGEHELDPANLNAWLLTINDLRLALGTRIGLDHETQAQLSDESLTPIFGIYDWLSGVQSSLVESIEQ